jgi:hypothetical protein
MYAFIHKVKEKICLIFLLFFHDIDIISILMRVI